MITSEDNTRHAADGNPTGSLEGLIISPIIKKNGGHINQILNGSFIALFPESATNAVKASIEISDKAQIFNEMHSAGYTFNPKIGIHFGKMIIGTVGVEDSLHETIISETVIQLLEFKNSATVRR